MSMQDPISDMIVIIKNGQMRNKESVQVPASNIKIAITDILKQNGYIKEFEVSNVDEKRFLTIKLKYFNNKPVIEDMKRVSKPGIRNYKSTSALPKVRDGLGIAIISTSQGLMTDQQARDKKLGGEVVCIVY